MAQRKLSDWMRAYGEYTRESDSPQVFHLWCALGTIAGAAQRKIYMHSAKFDVFTNMYIVLVSPPGLGKKTSAMRAAKAVLREVEPKVNFVSESGSFEGIVGSFTKISNPSHQSMTLYSLELGSIMATNAAGMVDFLTDIYDGNPDWSRQTVKHELQMIKRPWLNIMTGTTPKWMSQKLGEIALEGGLIARCILPYSDELLLDNPWPEDSPEIIALTKELAHDLSIIATLEGEFKFAGGKEGEAFQWYANWYRDKSRFPSIPDARTAGYYNRKHIHLLKLAMLWSLSYKDELLLELPDLQRALALLDSTEEGMRIALNAVGRNDRSAETQQILAQLRVRGRIPYKELLISNFHNLKEGKDGFDRAIVELRAMGKARLDKEDVVLVETPNGKN